MTSPHHPDAEDTWKIVTHRRRPRHFLPSPCSPPRLTTALSPLSLTYAQVVQAKHALLLPTTPTMSTQTNPINSQTNPQNSQVSPKYVPSPHSPTLLRYPPNPHYQEWWDRCFRCTRKGYIVVEYKYPRFNHNPNQQAQPVQPVQKQKEPELNPSAAPLPAAL